jgi:hypothetical protein
MTGTASTGSEDRRCGVEIEFSGLDAHAAAEVIAGAIGGTVERTGRHAAKVQGSAIGDIKVYLDTRYAQPAKDPTAVDRVLEALKLRDGAAELLATVMPVPVELVTEPITRAQFAELDRAVEALRASGAGDTKAGTLYAYGMHLNPEHDCGPGDGGRLGDGAARAIRIAAAYAFAERWLRHLTPPDNMRRVTPFVDPYSESYVEELADACADGRAPDMGRFVALYAEYNPDRNRGLDMWPLIGHLAPRLAERFHDGPIKNARPTFHYRLPDSRVSLPGWSPRDGLDRWEAIERAADDPDTFERLRRAAAEFAAMTIPRQRYYAAVEDVLG